MTEILNLEALQKAVEENPVKCRYCLKPLPMFTFEGRLDAIKHLLAHSEFEPEGRPEMEAYREWLELVCALPRETKARLASQCLDRYMADPKNREALAKGGFLTKVRHG